MSTYCDPCERWFNSYHAYHQHVENSPAHRYQENDWECEVCDRCFSTERARHQHYSNAAGHAYCVSCERIFMNQNNLMQHMHSRIHQGSNITCPWCKNNYTTASGLTIHLESGTCTSGLNRQKINQFVQKADHNNVITKRMITLPGYTHIETIATDRAWNGSGYECYMCRREFGTLHGLNNHLKSPVHEQALYRCPGRGCGREYKVLSGLVQHVESETCGLMRFAFVQSQAKKGIKNMVGRMITG